MVDILVRNVDDTVAAQLKKKAKAAGKSVNDIAREALRAAAKPSKEEIWAEIDRVRKRIGKISSDSTADIREDRDSR
jgi:plasmid stability protein